MSLWHADKDTRKEQVKRAILKKEAESFRELEDMFDEFDSSNGKSIPKKKEEQVEFEEHIKPPELPSFEYAETPEDSSQKSLDVERNTDFYGDENYEEFIENNSTENLAEEIYSEEDEEHDKFKHQEEHDTEIDDFKYEEYEPEEFSPIQEDELHEDEIYEDLDSLHDEIHSDSNEKEVHNEPEPQRDGKYKEIDEDGLKNFFSGILLKLKGNKDKDKPNENENKRELDKEPRKKKSKSIKLLIPLFILIAVIIAGYIVLTRGYSPISELSGTDKDANVTISNLEASKKYLSLDMKNEDSISKSGYFKVVLEQRTSNPFKKDEIQCESDIVDIMTGQNSKQNLLCSHEVSSEGLYKIKKIEEKKL